MAADRIPALRARRRGSCRGAGGLAPRRHRGRLRQAVLPAVAGVGVAVSLAVSAGALLLDRAEDPVATSFATLFLARAAAVTALAGALGWSCVRRPADPLGRRTARRRSR